MTNGNRRIRATVGAVSAGVFFMASFAWGSLPKAKHVVRLDQIGHIKLGDSIDQLPKLSLEKHRAHFERKSHFSFYMFSPNLPEKCMNLQCGTFAIKVLRHGGILLGGKSHDYAQDIGVGETSSLLLVTDEQDHVTAIYRDISRDNLDEALALLK